MPSEAEPGSAARSTLLVALPGEGVIIQRRGGQRTAIKVGEADAGGAFALHENSAPGGFGAVPLHIHRDAEEAFYVLEGEMTVYIGSEAIAAPAGTFVLIPRGAVHSVANLGDGPVRWLTLFSPAAGAGWVEAVAELQASKTDVTPGELAATFHEHGMEIVGPPPDANPSGGTRS